LKNHRQAHADEDRILQRDDHGEDEGGHQHHLLHGAGLPHRLQIRRLDGPVADQHEQAGQGRHGDVGNQAGEGEDHHCHHHAGDHEGHA
jgi:hypothetical protein